ncbi:MAG: T9SS type A sorting domain-containing protein [Bacteroidales bacterium]|nr:T9SS type A sorting domain-containing protein [Bacteroidales bacterium]
MASTGNDLSYVQGVGGAERLVPPHQGFFVSATAAGTFSLGDAERTHSGADNFYKNDNPQMLVLEASNDNFSDKIWIHFNENAGVEHDGIYDAYNRISLSNPELPQIFSITQSGTMLSINGMPETSMVPVGFTAVESGVFTISAVETGEFANVVLEDLLTQTQTDLLSNPYTFNYTTGDQENRFIVHFTPLAVPEIFEEMVNIFSFNTSVYVTAPVNTKGNIFIYNMMGQEVASKRINDMQNIITLEKSSYYVVKVLSDESVVTKKVFIK